MFSKLIRWPVVFGNPYSISIEPTTRCNLKCSECTTGRGELKRRSGDMDFEVFKTITNQIAGFAYTVLLHFQGEPMMNPQIFSFIAYATSKKIVTEMATNATLINKGNAALLVKSGLKKIVVSVDSANFNTTGQYRKGERSGAVAEGIAAIINAKKEIGSTYPIVVLELLMFKNNVSEISTFRNNAKTIGADVIRLKTVQVVSDENVPLLVPLGTKYSRYKLGSDGSVSLKANSSASCSAPWFKLSVTHDRWIVPCCFDKNAQYILGSLRFASVKEIWKSEHYNRFRMNVLTRRNSMPVCSDCPYGRMPLDYKV